MKTIISGSLLLLLYAPYPAFGQQWGTERIARRWSVTAYLGVGAGAVTKDIEQWMVKWNFDDRSSGGCFFIFCIEPRNHPYSYGSSAMLKGNIRYYLTKRYTVGLDYTAIRDISVRGYHSRAGSLHLTAQYKSFAPIFSAGLYDLVTLGIGPTFNFVRAENQIEYEATTAFKLGMVVDFSLKVPQKSLLYLAFNFQYQLMGKVRIGPFTASQSFQNLSAVLPQSNIDFTHTNLGFGIGVRL